MISALNLLQLLNGSKAIECRFRIINAAQLLLIMNTGPDFAYIYSLYLLPFFNKHFLPCVSVCLLCFC